MAVRVKLPIYIRTESKYSLGGAMFAFAAAVYLITNHFHLIPPRELPMTWADSGMPFMPYTVWIYLSEFAFFTAAYITARDTLNLNKYFYSFTCLQALSCLIFWAWPTTYPRAMYPLPESLDAVTRYFFISLRETDTPANCCPSLHVSMAYLTAFMFFKERKHLVLFLTWATAIAVSTLTTKQHYVADVVAGLGFALIHYWVFFKWAAYEDLSVRAQSTAGAQAKR